MSGTMRAALKASDGSADLSSSSDPLLAAEDPEAGMTLLSTLPLASGIAKPLTSAKAARALVFEELEKSRSRSRWKIVLYAVAALLCGILTFNFHYIIQISHIHLSLAHSHRSSAFCAYVGCKLNDIADVTRYHAAPEVVAALSARVCGSPAMDGYAHVVPKCLEDSPTNQWWVRFNASGGNQTRDLVVHIDPQADYDGLAVFWGIGNKKANEHECAAHCLRHMPNVVGGPYEHLPCNAFSFCPFDICFEPDAHTHTKGDCWLKFTEAPASPEVNMRGVLPPEFRKRHAKSPNATDWISGVLLPKGVALTNGTWSPRWLW